MSLAFKAPFAQAAAEVSLQRLKGDFKAPVLAPCEPWASQYQEPKMRYKFLILRGGSQSGKSTLAKSLGDIFGLGKPFIQTVQDAEAADLKGFDRQQYGYILFDNINSMEFVLSQRALFQAIAMFTSWLSPRLASIRTPFGSLKSRLLAQWTCQQPGTAVSRGWLPICTKCCLTGPATCRPQSLEHCGPRAKAV